MKYKFIGDILGRHQTDFLRQLLTIYKSVLKYNKSVIPSDTDLRSLLRKKDIRFIVALDGNTVVGGLTAHLLPSVFGDPRTFYIQDIAVKKKYQRQGAGAHVIQTLIYECRAFRHESIFVQADLSNKAAIQLFKAKGATPTAGFHFTYENVIKVPKYKVVKRGGELFYTEVKRKKR